jgi:hypothetical protein
VYARALFLSSVQVPAADVRTDVPVVDELQGGRVVSLFVRLEGPARAEAPLVLLYAAPPRFSFSFRRIVPRLAERGTAIPRAPAHPAAGLSVPLTHAQACACFA